MLDQLRIETGALLAREDTRIVEGLLLPFGEVGSTNLGRVAVEPDAVPDPEDLSVLAVNLDHDQLQPAARFAWLQRTPAGLLAGFRIAEGAKGDAILADVRSPQGKRKKLSVELANVVRRGARVVSAELSGAAFVQAGAFPSAALLAQLVDAEDEQDPTAQDAQPTAPAGSTPPPPAAAPTAQPT